MIGSVPLIISRHHLHTHCSEFPGKPLSLTPQWLDQCHSSSVGSIFYIFLLLTSQSYKIRWTPVRSQRSCFATYLCQSWPTTSVFSLERPRPVWGPWPVLAPCTVFLDWRIACTAGSIAQLGAFCCNLELRKYQKFESIHLVTRFFFVLSCPTSSKIKIY